MNHFIDQALIFIASALLLVPTMQYLGFGSVLGYLIAGVVIGPQALKFIQDSSHIIHVAEIGVVLLLFMIGLEIRPQSLWSMRKSILTLGIIQVTSCSIVFSIITFLSGQSFIASGIIGFALSLSSTAFVIQTLNEKNQLKSEFGRSSFAILLTQDLMAIPALAFIPALMAKSSSTGMDLMTLAYFIGIVLLLVLAGRYVMHPIFRLTAKTHNREVFMALALFIVVGVASLMLKIGLSAALGTFIAGVLLADSQYRHELEASLDSFKSIFMGLFFIGVGLGVSVDLIMQKPFLVLGLSLGYLLIKMSLIYITGRLARLGHENSKLLGLNLAQGGEFAFVIFAMATGFIANEVLVLLTAMITISIAINPLLIFLNDKLTNNCPKPVLEKNYDEVKDESPQVIIAGFGRFGQTFGRILKLQQIPFVAIDHDVDQIELVRKFGNKVYYGDVGRLELLESAGAAKAKYFILAVDDIEHSIKTANLLKEHFPNLKIFARARNRGHYFELKELGIPFIKRELFDSSVSFVGDLLKDMGNSEARVELLLQKFVEHDEVLLEEQFKVRTDDDLFISASQQGQAQLEQVLAQEAQSTFIKAL